MGRERWTVGGLALCGGILISCGDAGSSEMSGDGSADDAASITASAGGTANTGAVDGTVGGEGAASTPGSATDDSNPDDDADEGPGEGENPVVFDVNTIPDAGEGGVGGCGCGNSEGFSFIWIANSTQSTVTKLNTVTMAEEGRFLTRADGAGSPSRTSVSIDGRAVGVANRNGNVVKVWAHEDFCDPMNNGVPGIQTSTDMNYLPWGQDDCVAWEAPFNYSTQRPVAWGPGPLNSNNCEYEEQVLWTGGCQVGVHTWVQVSRIDGETGVILDTIDVPDFGCSSLSPYGAAIDSNGDFWMTNLVPGTDRLAHVDVNGILVEVIEPPLTPYGMTVDSQGLVWLAAWTGNGGNTAGRYDPIAQTWDLANNHVASVMSGIQEDSEGRMWMNYWTYDGDGSDPGLVYIDSETMLVSDPYGIGCGSSACRGMSIDLDGNVWSTSSAQNMAFRFNPDTLAVDTYNQLVSPYTYSDMTGWALQNAECNGVPTG